MVGMTSALLLMRRCAAALNNEQSLDCLSNIKKSTRADVDLFIAKWRITVFFL